MHCFAANKSTMASVFFILMTLGLIMSGSDTFAATTTSGEDVRVTESYKAQPGPDELKTSPQMTLTARHSDDTSRHFYLFDVHADLWGDPDHNGFYSGMDISFDLDVDYGNALVFADIWIRDSLGHTELIHSTDLFRISGAMADDEYLVSTELLRGYAPDYYEVQIELYDYDYSLTEPVAYADGYTHPVLSVLPLESSDYRYHDSYVSVHTHSGSFWLLLPGLLAMGIYRSMRHRKED